MTLSDLMAVVEKEFIVYSGETPRDGYSYVCSSYVTALWKQGGIFDGLHIESTEFTPKDVYTLNVFETGEDRPQACKDADPTSNWCQIMGRYRMTFPGFNTIAPYDHMAEHCEGVAPDYIRNPGC